MKIWAVNGYWAYEPYAIPPTKIAARSVCSYHNAAGGSSGAKGLIMTIPGSRVLCQMMGRHYWGFDALQRFYGDSNAERPPPVGHNETMIPQQWNQRKQLHYWWPNETEKHTRAINSAADVITRNSREKIRSGFLWHAHGDRRYSSTRCHHWESLLVNGAFWCRESLLHLQSTNKDASKDWSHYIDRRTTCIALIRNRIYLVRFFIHLSCHSHAPRWRWHRWWPLSMSAV